MALIGMTGGDTWPPVTSQKGPAVNSYEVEINGVATTLQLSDDDAKARGLKPVSKEKAAPANKSATPQSKKADAQ